MFRLLESCVGLAILSFASATDDNDRLAAAEEALRAGDVDRVLERLEPLLGREPVNDATRVKASAYAANALRRRGEDHFRAARISESIQDFEREIELAPARAAGHWQLGIAYYYGKEYQKGARQFELHRTVNPEDVENAAWHFLCVVRSPAGSVESAQKSLIPVKHDERVPLKEVHELFAGKASVDDVLAAAKAKGARARFYADLYLGLYFEALGQSETSLRYIELAAKNPSSQNHYMGDVARVHAKLRTVDGMGPTNTKSQGGDSRRP